MSAKPRLWQQRREVLSYGITPVGAALLARINETETAEQPGLQAEAAVRQGLPVLDPLGQLRCQPGPAAQ